MYECFENSRLEGCIQNTCQQSSTWKASQQFVTAKQVEGIKKVHSVAMVMACKGFWFNYFCFEAITPVRHNILAIRLRSFVFLKEL